MKINVWRYSKKSYAHKKTIDQEIGRLTSNKDDSILLCSIDSLYQLVIYSNPRFSESSKLCFREKKIFLFHFSFSIKYALLLHNFYYPVKDVTWKNIERDYLKKEKWMSSNPFECRSSTSVTRNKFLDTTTSCIELAFLYDTGILFSKNGFC